LKPGTDPLLMLRRLVAAGVSLSGSYRPLHALASRLFGGFVLAFHDIEVDRFRELVCALRPSEPVHLGELVGRLERGASTKGLFAITVDDGVRDTVQSLSAVASLMQWPVTFFLPTRYLDTSDGMPFQWLDKVLAVLPTGRLDLPSGEVLLRTDAERSRWTQRVRSLMRTRPVEEYEPLIQELVNYAVDKEWMSRQRDRPPSPISWEEVTKLSSDPAIRFESHGVTHTAVSALSAERLAWELRESQQKISQCTNRACRHFCYPYGDPESIGDVAPGLVATYYDSAVTMSRGRVERRDRFLMPRIPIYSRDNPAVTRLKVVTV